MSPLLSKKRCFESSSLMALVQLGQVPISPNPPIPPVVGPLPVRGVQSGGRLHRQFLSAHRGLAWGRRKFPKRAELGD
jgi:hypothetical protein